MNYLQNHIGKVIHVGLNTSGKKDRTMIRFFETDRNGDSWIGNKLLGVDSLGIWIEGFSKITRYVDSNNDPIPDDQLKSEFASCSVFIPYGYIEGMTFINDPALNESSIGFLK